MPNDSFAVKDCTLIAVATGKRAQNVRELREHLRDIDPNCIYYHFWGGLLRPRFDNPEFHNDFAIWTARSIHNKALAEQLAVIDPAAFMDLEELRSELIDVIEEGLDETEYPVWAKRDDQFEFIRSQIVVFDTRKSMDTPQELGRALPGLSLGSIFYHLIDARRRNENELDDFRNWLFGFGEAYRPLWEAIDRIDPYFSSLTRLRHELTDAFENFANEG